CWDGVRNYQARNFIGEMKIGDKVLFYHSQVKPPAIMGIAKVIREAYPDPTQFDPASKYYDPKSSEDNPRWFMADIQYDQEFESPIPLPELREIPGLEKMELLRKGSRLSVQPVDREEFEIVKKLRRVES
ncbi:EVE domain-containing protein, partial [Candidatus Saccharibacteria bacterium]|nr:EVE domain-containing protein [Candidatus Saccharibacteria bacterium]NIV73060.1 EVE domain-containing protein [Calditrichia bacterium]NIW00333.1 EVE domain-containing protein [Candidatus Saccharibacteria bacterium]NIW80692.1 EVE domain-containing protein [Calditrichia bacterium]